MPVRTTPTLRILAERRAAFTRQISCLAGQRPFGTTKSAWRLDSGFLAAPKPAFSHQISGLAIVDPIDNDCAIDSS